ncbi:uncharacterized protein LOC121415775 [Lytechinus variegatus]|uniref:uncharacterized protein LOC121415775 n=1 Tax=Lytechinus variegatus TaxID=7654 RepID=UPI001BB0E43B|nr:uncharacterized protein LOC121415775 [Lytechinus variegatus]
MMTKSTMSQYVFAVVFLCLFVQNVTAKREIFRCDFEDPRSSLCGFRVQFPQKSLEHRDEQWDVRRAWASRGGRDGPTTDTTLNTPQGSYGYTKATNQTGRYFYSFRVMIVSPSLVLSSGRGRLSFSAYLWTHLHPVRKADNLPTFRVRGCGDEISWSLQGRTAAWQEVDITINCNKTFQLVLEAIHRMPGSSVAVDDIRVTSMLDLKDHFQNRVTSSSFDHYDETFTSPPTTTTEGNTIDRSLLITLSGPTIGAIVGIILVILLLNLLIFIILRFKVKNGKRRQASLRRQSKAQIEQPHDTESAIKKDPIPVDHLKKRYIDEDNYIVPDEGFCTDDLENTCDSFMDTSTSCDTNRSSETHYTGLSLVRTSSKEGSWENRQQGGETISSLEQDQPPREYSVKRKAPLKPVLSLRSDDGKPDSPPPKKPPLIPNLRKETLTSDSVIFNLHGRRKESLALELPLSPRGGGRKESLTPEAVIFNPGGRRKESLTPDLPLSPKGGGRKQSLTPEIPLPLYKRKESLTPEIPVMLVTGRRKESLTPETPVAPKVGKRKESLIPKDAEAFPDVGKRKESLTPDTQPLTPDKPTILVPGRRKQSLTPEAPSPVPPTGRRKESLTPETPTMPLPDIPRIIPPTIQVSGDVWSSPGYTELSHTRKSIRRDYENAQLGKEDQSDKNTTPKSNSLNVSQDETGYLTPSGLSTGLPFYESADPVKFARERAKRSTRKLIHEYHDLSHSNNKSHPQYESSVIMATTPPKRMQISTIWDADSDYEELHI